MICTTCGAENRPGSKFCDQCATPLALACPACGEPNRADARFCASCASPLAGADPASAVGATGGPSAERRLVSVLFADLVGFTTFAEGRDPEHVRSLQSRYFEAASEAITRHGGTVEKFIGDAVMAVWGTPIAHEDDAQRAVRAGLEVVDSVRALGHDLDARAGVVTGEAAVTIGATNQGMVAGDMVNTASRLQSSAGPGEVLADQSTVHAASATIAFEPADERQLKGKAEAMRAWRAVRAFAARSGEGLVEPPFVGRADELRRVKELLHAVGREQRIRLVSITGPAGIGKSRLIEELGVYADGLAEDVWWHTGRSPSYGEGIAFWALGEMIRQRAGLAETDDAETTVTRVAATVEEFVSDPTEREWIASALLALLGLNAESAEGESLFPAWRTFFERVAQRGTTVLVFEDLQWADSGTLDFIEHLLDWSRAQPMLVVTLARPELLDTRAGWGTGRSNSTAIALEPMADAEMRELLNGMLPGLSDDQVGPIIERAGGMPLYAVEMVRALLAEGRIERRGDAFVPIGDLDSMPIPVGLRSLIASRLDALSAGDRTLLQHGAVLGLSFSSDALASVSGASIDELEPQLRHLVRRELLEIEADPRSPERGQYRFVQSLIREVAYDTLAMRDRRSRHLAAARHLEAAESDEAAGALATHYLAAYRASDEGAEADAVGAQARISLRSAADRAARLGAHEQAVGNLEHALELTREPRERAELLERAAGHANAAGLVPADVRFAQDALELYREIGDRSAAIGATTLVADLMLDAGRVSEASELLTEAVAGLADSSDAGWGEPEAALLSAQSRAEMRSERNDASITYADRALVIAERQNHERVAATALVNKGSALSQLGRRREGASLLETGIRLAEREGLVHLGLRARQNLGTTLADDEPARAVEVYRQTVDLAERLGDRGAYTSVIASMVDMTLACGTAETWRESDELVRKAMDLTSSDDDLIYLIPIRLFIDASAGGDVREGIAELERLAAASSNPRVPIVPLVVRTWHACLERRWDDTAAAASNAIERDPWPALWLWHHLANAVLRTGDIRRLEAARRRADEVPISGAWSNAARTAISAVLAAVEGRTDDAYAQFADAIARYRSAGLDWDAALATIVVFLALPDDPRVRAWAPQARATFEAVGATAWAALLDDAVDAAGAGRPEVALEGSAAPTRRQ